MLMEIPVEGFTVHLVVMWCVDMLLNETYGHKGLNVLLRSEILQHWY